MHTSKRRLLWSAAVGLLPLATIPSLASAQDWKPTRQILYTIPAGPGGALDQAVRMVKSIAERRNLIDKPILVENKPGGAGRVALGPLEQNPGDPHYLTVITYSLLTNHIIGNLTVGHKDYQPIAMLFGEYVTLSVKADSPVKDARDLIERFKKDPRSMTIGVATSLGNHIHVGAAKPLQAAGVDIGKLTVVPFKSSQESLTNMLGGHLDIVASTTPNVIGQMRAKRIRVLAVAAPTRLGGDFSAIPTWRELGFKDGVYNSAQGVMTSKGIPPAALRFWENFFRTVTSDPEWTKFVQARQWAPRFLDSAQTAVELDSEYAGTRQILGALGLAKR
jgi:putative tricarboxylic transport membrane protein